MRKARNCFLFLLLVFCLPVLLMGQSADSTPASKPATAQAATAITSAATTPKTPEEFFARARQLSDLEAAGVPFHLKATFVATGDTEYTGNGTYEEWWQSKNVWRKKATLGSYKYVAVHNGTEKAASATMAYTPLRVRQVEGLQIFDIAPPKGKKPIKWKITRMNLNGIPMTIVGSRNTHNGATLSHEYSFANDGALSGYRDDDFYEHYNDFQSFDILQFPRRITLALHGQRLLAVRILTLERLSKDEYNRFDPNSVPDFGAKPSLFVKLENGVSQKGITPPKVIRWKKSKYPESMKRSHSTGTVAIDVTVDAKGAVREPFIAMSAGPAFDETAIRAVRAYKFRPTMKNKRPVMTDVKVIIRFRIW